VGSGLLAVKLYGLGKDAQFGLVDYSKINHRPFPTDNGRRTSDDFPWGIFF